MDDKTLEFELRQGVKFHNGEAFDADDVVYTINFVSNPANKAITSRTSTGSRRRRRSTQYKVRIRLKEPFPAALEYLAGPIADLSPTSTTPRSAPRA